MPILKNHEVWIESDGKRYEEYKTEVEGNVVTCYIASEAEKVFEIGWRNHESPLLISTRSKVTMDDISMRGVAWDHTSGCTRGRIPGLPQDSKTYRPYKFTNIVLTDNGGQIASNDWKPPRFPDNFGQPLDERSNKAGCHRIGFDNLVHKRTTPYNSLYYKQYGSDVGPYVTFRFVYRPKDMLQALEIVPAVRTKRHKRAREPLSVAGPANTTSTQNQCKRQRTSGIKTDREVKDLSDIDQAERELLTQQAEVARKLEELRKRKDIASTRVKQEVKIEDQISMSAGFVLNANGVIDLTLD